MEQFRQLVAEATKAFDAADHLAYVTYPVVNDAKVLGLIADQLYTASRKGMDALLHYDSLYKRISLPPQDLRSRFDIFRQSVAKRYAVSSDELLAMMDLLELHEKRQQSTIEFKRRSAFVIASPEYRLRTLTLEKVKRYISHVKKFIHTIQGVLETSDRRFA